jgi:hypothetical protein
MVVVDFDCNNFVEAPNFDSNGTSRNFLASSDHLLEQRQRSSKSPSYNDDGGKGVPELLEKLEFPELIYLK